MRLPNEEFFVSMKEFNRDFEITAITMDDGKITREFEPDDFLDESIVSSFLSEQEDGQETPVMELT